MVMTYILGWIFLISSLFINFDVNVICASIFFAAHYIIKEFRDAKKTNNR